MLSYCRKIALCNRHLYRVTFFSLHSLLGSVFKSGWIDSPSEWYQPQLAAEFDTIRSIRSIAYKALSSARDGGSLRSFTEAEVNVVVNSEKLLRLLQKYSDTSTGEGYKTNYSLRDIFIVSQLSVKMGEGVRRRGEEVTVYSEEGEVVWKGENCQVEVEVWRAEERGKYKCPRCWLWIAVGRDQLCQRCTNVETK